MKMTSREQLMGSFGSLSDSLAFRFDPSRSRSASGRWLAVMGHGAAIGHRSHDWLTLPDHSARSDAVIAALDNATRAVVIAKTDDECMSALDKADSALDLLAGLLKPASDTPI
jgi:hypothetical protein